MTKLGQWPITSILRSCCYHSGCHSDKLLTITRHATDGLSNDHSFEFDCRFYFPDTLSRPKWSMDRTIESGTKDLRRKFAHQLSIDVKQKDAGQLISVLNENDFVITFASNVIVSKAIYLHYLHFDLSLPKWSRRIPNLHTENGNAFLERSLFQMILIVLQSISF